MRSKAKSKLHSSGVKPDLGAANIISVVKLRNLPAPNSPQPEGKKKKTEYALVSLRKWHTAASSAGTV
jgi:hypothetical protein